MEDVLEVYERPRDADAVLVCADEICKQLTSEVAPRLGPRPGDAAKEDYEYVREGCASMFIAYAPHGGKRHVYVSESGTRKGTDYAEFLRLVSDEWFPDSKRIVLVEDNLSTHTNTGLYEAFPPGEALRIAQRFERHHTPTHGSWLNVAESELSVLARQCLARRIAHPDALRTQSEAWSVRRNKVGATTSWQFTNEDARVKLHKLYPTV
jgi:hypothetical protein